ncbi:MAG: hypothetical protein E7218_04805 [Anaerofustis stercorihominis]|nr:hypothetical protein [Anaerofustis stercorihominis]
MKNLSVSQKQFHTLLLFSFIALNFVSFSGQVALLCGTDGIIPLIINASVMYLFCVLLIRFMLRNKGLSFYGALKENFGKTVSVTVCIIYAATCLYLCAYAARIICSQINIYMLDKFDLRIIEGIFILSCVYAASKSFKTLSNFSQVLIKPTVFVLILLLVLCINNADILNMLPLFTSSAEQYFNTSMHLISYNFSSSFAIAFILPYVRDYDIKKGQKQLFYVMILSVIIFSAYYVLCIGVLGVDTCRSIIFPAINVMHNNVSPGILLNRYEIIIVFAVTILYFLYTALMLKSGYTAIKDITGKNTAVAVSVSVIAATLTALNDRTVGEYVASIFHIKGILGYVPIGMIILLLLSEIKERKIKYEGKA